MIRRSRGIVLDDAVRILELAELAEEFLTIARRIGPGLLEVDNIHGSTLDVTIGPEPEGVTLDMDRGLGQVEGRAS